MAPFDVFEDTKNIAPLSDKKYYEIYNERKNFCLVFNAYKVNGFEDRNGSEEDVKRIKTTFELIRGFEVKSNTLTSSEFVMDEVSTYVKECQNSDMMICFFMSHGDTDYILAENGDKIEISSILNWFLVEKAKPLADKPKLLIFQACRGKETNELIPFEQMETDCIAGSSDRKLIPNLSDYFMAFPTSPGYVANRHPKTGSPFINAFCDVVKENYKRLPLLEIFLEVNKKGKDLNISGTTQIAEMQTNLSKHVYFDFPD